MPEMSLNNTREMKSYRQDVIPELKYSIYRQKAKIVCLGNYKLVQLKNKAHAERKLEIRIKCRQTMKLKSSHHIQYSASNEMNNQKPVN